MCWDTLGDPFFTIMCEFLLARKKCARHCFPFNASREECSGATSPLETIQSCTASPSGQNCYSPIAYESRPKLRSAELRRVLQRTAVYLRITIGRHVLCVNLTEVKTNQNQHKFSVQRTREFCLLWWQTRTATNYFVDFSLVLQEPCCFGTNNLAKPLTSSWHQIINFCEEAATSEQMPFRRTSEP